MLAAAEVVVITATLLVLAALVAVGQVELMVYMPLMEHPVLEAVEAVLVVAMALAFLEQAATVALV